MRVNCLKNIVLLLVVLVIAGKGGSRDEVVYETADLFYHSLVLLAFRDIPLDEVLAELRRRFGVSGIEEKAARS